MENYNIMQDNNITEQVLNGMKSFSDNYKTNNDAVNISFDKN